MEFTGDEGSYISLDQARTWIANFRLDNPGAVSAFYLGKNKISEIINQQGCVGIRIYNAVNGNQQYQLVVVGVDKDGREILDSGKILDQSIPFIQSEDSSSLLDQ